MSPRLILAVAVLFLFPILPAAAEDGNADWPREIVTPKGVVTVYQPQIESVTQDRITARSAVSVKMADQPEAVFGTVWFHARMLTDRTARVVTFEDITVPNAVFPNAKKEQIDRLRMFLASEAPSWDLEMSLDRLVAAWDAAKEESSDGGEFRTDPPVIRYVDHAAVLVVLDGEAKLQAVEGSTLMRVANSPYFIVLTASPKAYWLPVGKSWMTAPEVAGPWRRETRVPAEVTSAAKKAKVEAGDDGAGREKPPEVIVATEPTELIQSEGKAEYTPIKGTNLLFLANSEQDVFMDIGTQKHYVLLSGRWYESKKLAGGAWSYVAPDALPPDFAKIPADSTVGHVLASVAGTQQAREAVLEAYVPQTNKVDRTKPVDVAVEYDGKPEFEPIEGTKLEYAVNTPQSVIRFGSMYYLCEDAVWYVSTSPTGPWAICTDVPDEVYEIPPENPNHNTTYVYVYDSTPEYVYVGYYPGYTGCYVYRGCIIYGTGWWYRSWWRRWYYPRPCTWGFSVRYNPWTGGWGFRVGYRGPNGGIAVGVGGGRSRGWWGPGGYRNVNLNVNRTINVNRNIYHRPAARPGVRPGPNPGTRPGVKPGTRPGKTTRPTTRPSTGLAKKNNVYTDKAGNIYRRTNDGWQRRDGRNWSKVAGTPPGAGKRPATGQRPAAGQRPTAGKR
ncbi:MAG: hypothetical protein ABFS86_17545, partial [Planctomycetota bacterium]